MRITKISLFILLIAYCCGLSAQSLVLCESYSEDGNASGIYKAWDIDPEGSFVYMLYKHSGAIRGGSWMLYIDYDWNNTGQYGAYETLEMKPETGKTWFVHDQKFTKAGKYKASVLRDGVTMATVDFEIILKAKGLTGGGDDDSDAVDTYYYENSSVQFCTSVDASGHPIGTSNTFTLGRDGTANFVVYIENNGNPFKTSKVVVEIYKDEDGNSTSIDSYPLDIQPEWDYMKFSESLTSPGKYYFDIYNNEDVFINTGTLEIVR